MRSNEQVSTGLSDGHQMSLVEARGPHVPSLGGELDGMTNRQTDTTENITFPQLRLRVVNTHTFISSPYVLCSVDNQFSMWTTQFN